MTARVRNRVEGDLKPLSEVLTAESIDKSYAIGGSDLVVLRGVSISLEAGSAVAIMGPSGCGKSTLLNICGTLDAPSGGRVTIDGVDPFALPEQELARFRNQRIGFVFQEHHLLPQCSVLENVLLPTLVSTGGGNGVARARTLLDRVGLADRIEHRPAELSGGERQRVAIARALVNEPLLLLADEPTGNLDAKTAESVADLLVEIHRDRNCALMVVTHSERLASRLDVRMSLADGTLLSA